MTKLILTSLLAIVAMSAPKRIQSTLIDRGEPKQIHIFPGLASVITFPCFVSDSVVGDQNQIEVRPNPNNKKIMIVNLKSFSSKATNLIIRCEGQMSHFVFDLIPSKNIHQDLVEIRAAFGRPFMEVPASGFGDFLRTTTRKVVIQKPILVQSAHRSSRK